MFYVMYDKITKRVLNWGCSQKWAGKEILSNYVVVGCKEEYPISPLEYNLKDVCKFDVKNKKMVLDKTLKLKVDKQKEVDILIEAKKTELAKESLIAEGVLDSSGVLKEK